MYGVFESQSSVRVVSHLDDEPQQSRGFLIPDSYIKRAGGGVNTVPVAVRKSSIFAPMAYYSAAFAGLMLFGGAAAFGTIKLAVEGLQTVAAPVVVVATAELPESQSLHYGVQPVLSHGEFFFDTREQFVTDKLNFISINLPESQLTLYEEGQEIFTADILSKGEPGSWWETPSGLYTVNEKKEGNFSSFSDIYQPWLVTFGGNFQIHGWPMHDSGTPVLEDYVGGGIRLSDEDAAKFYSLVQLEMPVLVHETEQEFDQFIYEPKAPDITALHYLVADIESNTILAASDLDAGAPIASITKLMTALVAAEHINLDDDVYVSQEKYVTTLVPRLNGRYTVSVYSLLQLLLVESSNEAAEVLAAQVGRDQFIALMNEKAVSLGLSNTVFTDPSGLDNGNVSTVSDLLRLVQYIQHNRSFVLELTYDQDLPTAHRSGEFGELTNFNEIEGVESFIGGKVGETLAAGQTSVSLHTLNINGADRTLAFIILGSNSRSSDLRLLETYVTEQFVR